MTGKTVGGPKILLVDDDKIVIEALTDLFKRILPAVGIVDSATSGVEALELFASNADQYALVLLDMSLEGMQGPEVCRRMRLMDCSTPILGMTSFSLNRYRVPLAAAGAQGLVGKGGTLMRVLVVDALALVLYIVVSLPAMTGVGAHEWLGLGIGLVLLVHGAQHVDFAGRLLTSRGAWRAKGRILLDAALVLSVAVAVLSGLMESGTVLPAFGFYAEGYYFWGPLHAASAKVLLALLVVHGALNLGSAWRLAQRARAKEDE